MEVFFSVRVFCQPERIKRFNIISDAGTDSNARLSRAQRSAVVLVSMLLDVKVVSHSVEISKEIPHTKTHRLSDGKTLQFHTIYAPSGRDNRLCDTVINFQPDKHRHKSESSETTPTTTFDLQCTRNYIVVMSSIAFVSEQRTWSTMLMSMLPMESHANCASMSMMWQIDGRLVYL